MTKELEKKTEKKNNKKPKQKRNYYGYRRKQNKKTAKETVPFRIIPLGGLKEIGKNCTILECNDEMLIIDCGFCFPDDEMFGIDVVIPDFAFLRENADKLKGLIVTHGHEDHIGGIPYLLKEFNIPIYASPLTLGLIGNKFEEHGLTAETHFIEAGNKFSVAGFDIEAIQINHSIADAMAFSIKCAGGHIVHTGDFKIDYYPLDGKVIDLNRFSQLGTEGVDLLISDSTNVLREGYTPSEQVVKDSVHRIFESTDKRIIVATFASNVHRIKCIMDASIAHGRRIAVSGRSMENVVQLAKDLGYLKSIPDSAFVDIKSIANIPDSMLTILTTGSQGEPMSALTRMATDQHRAVKLKKGDVVVFSSSPIPGNEKTVTNVVNKLYEKEVNVVLSDMMDVHVSGHACKEELRLLHTLVRPKFFMPAHGEYRHLIEHAELAKSLGMHKKNVFIMGNGDSLLINGNKAEMTKEYTSGDDIMVDGYGVGDIGSVVLKDRKQLSEAGLIIIAVAIDQATGALVAEPELTTRGFIYVKENMDLIEEATAVVYNTIGGWLEKGSKDYAALRQTLRDDMRKYIYKRTKRSPVILPTILRV